MPYAAMMATAQWLLCSIVDGIKKPVSPISGIVCDSTDPANWVSYEQVLEALKLYPGMRLAFALAGKFFLLDADKCGQPGAWNPIVAQLAALVPGALCEVSQSGRGLHWIGVAANPIEHSCKNTALGIELYTEGRFVALGDMATATGNAGTVCDLSALVHYYFQPGSAKAAVVWSDGPVPEWDGHLDDAELVAAARKSKSARSAFGGRASFEDLWTANRDILSGAFPAQNDRDPWDMSSADGALATHLRFWTGADCERIKRLMFQSDLVRDKWQRDDYIQATVASAVGLGGEVHSTTRKRDPVSLPTPEATEHKQRDDGTFVGASTFAPFFQEWVYLTGSHKMFSLRTGNLTGPPSFKALFGGHEFEMGNEQKWTTDAFKAFTETTIYKMAKVRDTQFRPDLPVAEYIYEDGEVYVNGYVPNNPLRKAGDVSPFINHIKRMYPHGDDARIIINYIAALVQNPGVKFQWCPVMVGAQGNGKTYMVDLVGHIVGLRFTTKPNAHDLGNKFNGWVPGCLLAIVEELNAKGDREVMEAIKTLVTNRRIDVQKKGVDQQTMWNFVNFLIATNNIDGVPISDDDRRFCVLISQQMGYDDVKRDYPELNYFNDLFDWTYNRGGLEAVAEFLLTFQVDAKYDPAGECQRAPRSTTTGEAVDASRGLVEQEVLAAIDEERQGFCGGWVSSVMLNKLIEDRRWEARMPRQKRLAMLKSLGYIRHPVLTKGRTNNIVAQEGARTVLYIKKDHLALNIMTCTEVVSHYIKSQGYMPLGATPHEYNQNG